MAMANYSHANRGRTLMRRRTFLRGAAAITAAAALPARPADAYPTRPITLLVPFAAGGVGDIVARSVSRKAAELLGKPIVIDNRPVPAAAPSIVAKANPDGYTLLLTSNGAAV